MKCCIQRNVPPRLSRLCRRASRGSLLLILMVLSGCATYGNDIKAVRADIATQQWASASEHLDMAISPLGADAILYYLEQGMLKHLQGDFAASNALLETAYGLMDPLFRTPVTDQLKAVVSSPRHNAYRGDDFERAMVSFIKIINDLNLASRAANQTQRMQHIQDARVEARRIRLALELAEALQQDASPGQGVSGLVADLMATDDLPPVPPSSVPLLDWLTALVYEMLGETDDARIAVQQALTGYSLGLPHSWGATDNLPLWVSSTPPDDGMGDVVLMQLAGLVPEQHEFNIFVGFQGLTQEFTYSPQYQAGDREYQQQLWFQSTIGGPKKRGYWARSASGKENAKDYRRSSVTVTTRSSQRVQSDSLLTTVLSKGFRVPIAYYDSRDFSIDTQTEVRWADGKSAMPMGLSVARKAMEDHADHAWRDFYLAFARELAQQMLAETVYQGTQQESASEGAKFLGALTQISASLGAQADTRTWLTLPKEINMVRLRLPVGKHRLTVATRVRGVTGTITQSIDVDVQSQQLQFLSLYTATGNRTGLAY